MERKIIFRGIYTDIEGKKKWVYGDLVHGKKITQTGLEDKVSVGGYTVDENTVGQYTGLKDINSKDIYEGDIIKSPMGNIVVVEFGIHEYIVHSNEATMQGYKSDSFQCAGWIVRNTKNNATGFLDWSFIEGEIIGNKFDNPELLKP